MGIRLTELGVWDVALDRLGNKKLQKKGSESANQTFDQTTHQLLLHILDEMRMLNVMMREVTGLDIEARDIKGRE